ncbi:MAG: ice-binding family protein [Gallionellaceae bacterium]
MKFAFSCNKKRIHFGSFFYFQFNSASICNMILNGSATDVWVFQITGILTQASNTQVQLTYGALA